MRTSIPLLCLLLAAAPGAAAAAVANDEVTSAKLKEADNTTAQDTNSGAGVKTGHLQNKAVTAAKLADGAVGTLQLAAGAVTDAKIAGPISAAKLPIGTTAGTVAAGNHLHDGLYQRRLANVVVVARSGGDFTDPVAALASITDASAANPYLVKIMPGDYLVSAPVVMKPFVDLEGSGRDITRLYRTTPSTAAGGAVLLASSASEVRDLTIEAVDASIVVSDVAPLAGATPVKLTRVAVVGNTTTANSVTGVGVDGGSEWVIEGSSITVGALGNTLSIGIFGNGLAALTIRGSEVRSTSAVGFAMSVTTTAVLLEGSRFEGWGGIGVNGAVGQRQAITLRNSTLITTGTNGLSGVVADVRIEGSTVLVPVGANAFTLQPGSDLRVAGSQVRGPRAVLPGAPVSVACFNNYTPEYTPYTCN
jgi:hypothetical protein